jgi:hypothetical protein
MSTKDQLLYSALHGTAMRYAAERRNLTNDNGLTFSFGCGAYHSCGSFRIEGFDLH